MVFTVYTSLKDHAGHWDNLLPADHYLRSVHLLSLEQCKLKDLDFSYLFFYRQPEHAPVAIAYFQHVHFTTRHYQFPLMKSRFLLPVEKLLMGNGYRILVCGNLFRIDFPGIYITDSQVKLVDIFKTLERYYKTITPEPHAILIKDCRKEIDRSWVQAFSYRNWPGDLTMKLDLKPEWNHFSDYVAALKHKYAQRVRKIQSKSAAIQRRELGLDDIVARGESLETLLNNVVKKQVIRLVIANKTYFKEMKRTLGDAFRVIGYFENDQLIAFSSHIVHEDCWELHYIGMDYNKNEKYLLYFNIMYDGIGLGIENGKQSVELGRTAREAKSMLGAHPIYFSSYFRLRGWLVNQLVSRFADTFNERSGETWKARNPLKSSK